MRRRTLILLVAALAGVTSLPAHAQEGFLGLTTIELSTPVGDTKRFTDVPLGAGIGWEGRWTRTPHVSAGFSVVFNQFSQREKGTTEFPSGAVTGDMLRQLFSEQLLGTAYHFTGQLGRLHPYVGGGLGVSHISQELQLGTQRLSRGAWHAVIAPEVGMQIHSGDGMVGLVSLRYNGAVASGDYLGGGSRRFHYFTLRLGFGEQ